MAQIGFISLIGVIRVIFIHIYQHCQSFNATVNTNRSFTCNIDYVIGEAILFIWPHTHHNPLSRLPYRPHNQLYLSRHIGTATQTTAHLLQLLPEVRIIVNPILQTYGKPPADSNPGNNTGPVRCGRTCVSQNSPYIPYFLFTSIKVRKTDEKKECFSNNNQLESTVINHNPPESTFRNPHIVSL